MARIDDQRTPEQLGCGPQPDEATIRLMAGQAPAQPARTRSVRPAGASSDVGTADDAGAGPPAGEDPAPEGDRDEDSPGGDIARDDEPAEPNEPG